MFGSFAAIPEVVFRASVIYIAIIIAFRLAGKRHISQLSVIDFALILLVSNAVQNAMVGQDTSILGGLAAALTLILINLILTRVIFRDELVSRLFHGQPRLLVRNGKPIMPNLSKEEVTLDELEESIREHGISGIEHVKTAILEIDGSISIIPYDPEGRGREQSIVVRRRKQRKNFFNSN